MWRVVPRSANATRMANYLDVVAATAANELFHRAGFYPRSSALNPMAKGVCAAGFLCLSIGRRSLDGRVGSTRPDGIDRIRTGCLEVGVTQNVNALTRENPAPHMRFKNAVVMGDVTFHWYRARDARKNTEHNAEESFGCKTEEANTTWTNKVANLALIRWRA